MHTEIIEKEGELFEVTVHEKKGMLFGHEISFGYWAFVIAIDSTTKEHLWASPFLGKTKELVVFETPEQAFSEIRQGIEKMILD